MRQAVSCSSQPLKERLLARYLKPGMVFETQISVSCTTSCASASVKPVLMATLYMSFQYVSKKVRQLSWSFQSFNRVNSDARVGIKSFDESATRTFSTIVPILLIRKKHPTSFKKS